MPYFYLSPHLDDVSLSCGGLVWEQVQAGEQVEIWTICAGDPPPGSLSHYAEELHWRWGYGRKAIAERRIEDKHSCKVLGAGFRHFEVPDAVYRSHPKTGEILYDSEKAIFGGLKEDGEILIRSLVLMMTELIPPGSTLVAPLTLGNHVDHQLTRTVAERMKMPLAYYAEYPYVLDHAGAISALVPSGYHPKLHTISIKGLEAWQDSVAAHTTQISTFWPDVETMREEITKYHSKVGGVRMWNKKN